MRKTGLARLAAAIAAVITGALVMPPAALAAPQRVAILESTATAGSGNCYGHVDLMNDPSTNIVTTRGVVTTSSGSFNCTLYVYLNDAKTEWVTVVDAPGNGGTARATPLNFVWIRVCQSGSPGKCDTRFHHVTEFRVV